MKTGMKTKKQQNTDRSKKQQNTDNNLDAKETMSHATTTIYNQQPMRYLLVSNGGVQRCGLDVCAVRGKVEKGFY